MAIVSRQKVNFALIMEHAFACRLYKSNVHGIEHWRQVEHNGILLADNTGADIDVVRLFAIFHDSKRSNDNYDSRHGMRGAEFAKECRPWQLWHASGRCSRKVGGSPSVSATLQDMVYYAP